MAAAGMVNPVTGRRLTKIPRIGTYLPKALHTYRQLAQQFHKRFYHPRPLLRLFRQPEETASWQRRRADHDYACWVGREFTPEQAPWPCLAAYGGYHQPHAGYLDIPSLLSKLRSWLAFQGSLLETELDTRDLGSNNQGPFRARHIILCQGHRARHCPWFGWLPFQTAKGEILTLHSSEPMPRRILNQGRWLLPTEDGQWRLGASFERNHLNSLPTPQARDELLQALDSLLHNPGVFRLIGHQAGIRPATLDTQPFLGLHPKHPGLSIFNGFGAKGSLMIPWHASRFADCLEAGATLPEWADIRRYAAHMGKA